jgi:hypothetical protein
LRVREFLKNEVPTQQSSEVGGYRRIRMRFRMRPDQTRPESSGERK